MRRLIASTLWVAYWASGQQLLTPGRPDTIKIEEAFNQALKDDAAGPLACNIVKFEPRLSFGFRYWTGYDLFIPVKQFTGTDKPQGLITVLRVTPQGGAASYFFRQAQLPALPQDKPIAKNVEFSSGGGFSLGEGRYDLLLQVLDQTGRTCRHRWSIEAKKVSVPLRIEPGKVADNGLERWSGIPAKPGSLDKVTVFLHAAPVIPRRATVRLSAFDITVLLMSLTSLLDTSHFAEARVVAYSLDNRQVLFEEEHFDGRALRRLLRVLSDLNLGTISYRTLNGAGPAEVLEDLTRRESARPEPSQALVFLGPTSRYDARVSPKLKELRMSLPKSYSLSFPSRFFPDDIVKRFVTAGPGKALTLYQPGDLAKAIREIDGK
ncbi:MAG: hypothetical protein NTZ56_01260 [Acidobacteria bacterium]|nr:hypothetical protein [Acidobacteriota bacterium]